MIKYEIGDIVFASNYIYKNGEKGYNHFFVIVNEEQAIDFNYFGFLLSSNVKKAIYPYNEVIKKNKINKLKKDSIVKCDDLIQINNTEISFKIGKVSEKELLRFLSTYERYLQDQL